MKEQIAGRRYAEGFLNRAKETIGLEKGFEGLTKIKQIISPDPEFKKFFENSEITYAQKVEVIDKAFKAGFPDEITDFLKLIIKKGRIEQLLEIVDCAKVIYYREKGIEKAVLKTTSPLNKELTQRIKDKLEEKLRKKLELEVQLDPDLIGGAQAIVGNIVIDGSVKKALAELKEKLMAIKVY